MPKDASVGNFPIGECAENIYRILQRQKQEEQNKKDQEKKEKAEKEENDKNQQKENDPNGNPTTG